MTQREDAMSAPGRHQPVLLHEVLKVLDPKPGDFFIDGTLGSGGHAAAILERIGANGTFLGVDWDAGAISRNPHRASPVKGEENGKRIFVVGNYADLPEMLKQKKLGKADGLLIDLGFSSDQVARSARGFSFKEDEPLIMTYSEDTVPLRELLPRLTEGELLSIIRTYGEERYAERIAHAIYVAERRKPLVTSQELAETVASTLPKSYERGRIHPATRTFQAFRIYANRELENLDRLLASLPAILKPGGRAGIISFHSLEDRRVKNAFRDGAKRGALERITKKPVTASREEVRLNPRSRSAKLRAVVVRT